MSLKSYVAVIKNTTGTFDKAVSLRIRHVSLYKTDNYLFTVNNAIWLVDPPGATLVILDNLGWYCDIDKIFIRQRQIQIVPWNSRKIEIRDSSIITITN